MGTTATPQGGVQIVSVDGDLVTATTPQFRKTVEGLVKRDERDYVIDMSKTTALDSAGLEALTWLARTSEERLGNVRLCNVSATFKTIFKMTRLTEKFECFSNAADAVASFG